ncbi:hypothetical protein Bbelb_291550 [Branchiostoma belcheri]|nr:hypothetical protein Bbelb_291550 [Branchiostoma belcheri]
MQFENGVLAMVAKAVVGMIPALFGGISSSSSEEESDSSGSQYSMEINLKQQQCPVCATPRYKDGTKRPRKVSHYYSLIEYLTWLFSTRKFGTLATTHHTRADVKQDDLKFEVQDTEMWKGLSYTLTTVSSKGNREAYR